MATTVIDHSRQRGKDRVADFIAPKRAVNEEQDFGGYALEWVNDVTSEICRAAWFQRISSSKRACRNVRPGGQRKRAGRNRLDKARRSRQRAK